MVEENGCPQRGPRCQVLGRGSLKVQLRTEWKPLTSLDPARKDTAAVQTDCPGPGDEGPGAQGVTRAEPGVLLMMPRKLLGREGAESAGLASCRVADEPPLQGGGGAPA